MMNRITLSAKRYRMRSSLRGPLTIRRGIKSLAFTTHFLQPDLGMTEYEYLSRSTASLLSVDPRDTTTPSNTDGKGKACAHLESSDVKRKVRDFKRKHNYSPAVRGTRDDVKGMGWLQFMPKEHRPNVHCLCSSHVVSPFLWLDHYPLGWLTQVRQEHCKYSLEVFDTERAQESLASFELRNAPIHHPEGRDIAILHLKDEETALKKMKKFGVKIHHMRNPEKLYKRGETIHFDGFVVQDPNDDKDGSNGNHLEDTRIFEPQEELGILAFHTNDRFFASTANPLSEGLCGAPVLDADGELCGVVEGIVPVDHENQKIAGSAAFLPSFVLASFVDYTERIMLEQIMPEDIFQDVVQAKLTNTLGGGSFNLVKEGKPQEEGSYKQAYERQAEMLKKKYSKEEVDAILWNVKRERDEVLNIMNEEGGVLDDIIEHVRAKTLALRKKAREEYKKGSASSNASTTHSFSYFQGQRRLFSGRAVDSTAMQKQSFSHTKMQQQSGPSEDVAKENKTHKMVVAALDASGTKPPPPSKEELERRLDVGRKYVVGRYEQHNQFEHELACKIRMKNHAIKMLPRNAQLRQAALKFYEGEPNKWRHIPVWTPPIPGFDPDEFIDEDENTEGS